MNIIATMAFQANPHMKTVYYALDSRSLQMGFDETRNPLPEYLYDTHVLNDTAYVLNKSVLFSNVASVILNTMKGIPPTTFDQYSYWGHNTISQYASVKSYLDKPSRLEPYMYKVEEEEEERESAKASAVDLARENLHQNILPLIEAHPDTDFVLFFPPHSILRTNRNDLTIELAYQKYAIEALLPYNNVSLYYFRNVSELVTNMYHYKDEGHYSADINAWMVDCFSSGEHLLTAENYLGELDKMKALSENFDYSIFTEDGNPFIKENNFLRYMNKLNNPRYIAFIISRANSPISASSIWGGEMHKRLGLDDEKSGLGYIAILRGSSPVFQAASDDAIMFDDMVEGLSVHMLSERRDRTNYIEVIIDDITYTINRAGLNIVVYDTERRRVMDNIAVDITNGQVSRK